MRHKFSEAKRPGTAFAIAGAMSNLASWRIWLPSCALFIAFAGAIRAFPDQSSSAAMFGLASAAKTTTFWVAGILLLASTAAIGVRAGRRRITGSVTPVAANEKPAIDTTIDGKS